MEEMRAVIPRAFCRWTLIRIMIRPTFAIHVRTIIASSSTFIIIIITSFCPTLPSTVIPMRSVELLTPTACSLPSHSIRSTFVSSSSPLTWHFRYIFEPANSSASNHLIVTVTTCLLIRGVDAGWPENRRSLVLRC